MPINLDSVKDRLQTMQNKSAKAEKKANLDQDIYKPVDGEQQIRIVPYMHNKDYPFIEVMMHYNIVPKRSILSPSTYGNPDPIVEFAQKLQQTGKKEDWNHGKSLLPKPRTYAPIIVRGKESEGVKFWGFPSSIYTELLSYINDPDYGDITDPINGRDIILEIKKEAGKTYKVPSIRIKPNPSKISDDKAIIELVKNQKVFSDIITEPSYEELKIALHKFLHPEETESEIQTDYTKTVASESTPSTKSVAEQVDEEWGDFFNQ